MTTLEDVLAAIDRINRAGLADAETTRAGLDAWYGSAADYDRILDRLYAAFPQLFPPDGPAPSLPEPEQQGTAAQTMREAEELLAQQHSSAAEFDRDVIEALLQAHQTTVEGRKALDDLDAEIEDKVRTSDLSTPAGAREFQRFLLAKLAQIVAVVDGANDDDAAKAALAKALSELYDSQTPQAAPPDPPAGPAPQPEPEPGSLAEPYPGEADDYPDALPAEDPDAMEPLPSEPAAAPVPTSGTTPTMPAVPGLGGESPGGGLPGAGLPAGLAPAGWAPQPGQHRSFGEDPEADPADDPASAPEDPAGPGDGADPAGADRVDPRIVTLPDGQTVTADTPQLAAVVQAAADGTPIAEAFRRQGITIPPPGTAVAGPVDQSRVALGDIGMFTDRHALALGGGRALLDGQIQRIGNVRGPSFLGWQHPPGAGAAPARIPAPTRPSATVPA